jgi:preprotein translocase subunit SecD
MNVADADKRQTLIEQSKNVIERRMEAMGERSREKVTKTDSGAVFVVYASTQESLEALTEQLTRPFELRIMSQAAAGARADITVAEHGGFNETGITGGDLSWVEGRQQPGTNMGEVELVFTEEGRQKMSALFKQMKGRNIGLFVRDQLVSKLLVDTDELKDQIVIREIPQMELAQVFSEDVNVGIHVTFTPVP